MTKNSRARARMRLLGVIAAAVLAAMGACKATAEYLDCATPTTELGLTPDGFSYVVEASYAPGERVCR